MRIIRLTLIAIGVIQIVLGAVFLIPNAFAHLMGLPDAPTWASWMLTMFKTVDIAAGNHTFNHAYTGTAADYSQPRIAIFGTYK